VIRQLQVVVVVAVASLFALCSPAAAQSSFGSPTLAPPDAEAAAHAAIQLFLSAQARLDQALDQHSESRVQAARRLHAEAAIALEGVVSRYGAHDVGFEIRLMQAHALRGAGDVARAAQAYALVRDGAPGAARRRVAAHLVVELIQEQIAEAQHQDELIVRDSPPEPVGHPLAMLPLPMPELVERLHDSWARVPAGDPADVSAQSDYWAAQYEAGKLRYVYGQWDQARTRFDSVYAGACHVSEAGLRAYRVLASMAQQLESMDDVELLYRGFQEERCSFGEPVTDWGPFFRAFESCLRGRHGQELASRTRRVEASPQERAALIVLANEWVAAAERCPDEPERTSALISAGYVLEVGGEARWAADQYWRAQQHARAQSEAAGPGEQPLRVLEADAARQRGRALERVFEFDDALASYHRIIDDPVFSESDQPQLQDVHLDALWCALALHYQLRRQQEVDGLLRHLRRIVAAPRRTTNVEVARRRHELLASGVFLRSTLTAERGQGRQAIREFERFLAEFERDPSTAYMRLRARWQIFELRVDSGARSTRAVRTSLLRAVLEAASRPIENTIGVREWSIGRARFRLNDERFADLLAHLRASPNMTRPALERGIELADAVAAAHASEVTDSPLLFTVRGIARSADAYALLVRALDESTPSSEPADWQRAARMQLACYAVVLDRLALAHAHVAGLDTEWFATSINRLALTPPEVVRVCGEELPSAGNGFPVVPGSAVPTAPLGLRLPPGDSLHGVPDLADIPE